MWGNVVYGGNPGFGGNPHVVGGNPGYGGNPGLGGHCTMFVARVLCGQTAAGNSGLRVPPAGCHSCVNNIANPSFYIIFDHNQCYPEYMIEYIR